MQGLPGPTASVPSSPLLAPASGLREAGRIQSEHPGVRLPAACTPGGVTAGGCGTGPGGAQEPGGPEAVGQCLCPPAVPAASLGAASRALHQSGCFQRGSRKGHGAGVLEKERDRRECRLLPHLLRSTADKTLPWPLRKGLIAAEFSFLRAKSHFLPAEPC